MLRHAQTDDICLLLRVYPADVHDRVEVYWMNAQLGVFVYPAILILLAHVCPRR